MIQSHHNLKKNLPRLTKNKDVSELLLDPYSVGGLTSDSEVEDDAVVEIQQESLVKKKNLNNLLVMIKKKKNSNNNNKNQWLQRQNVQLN